MLSARGGGRFFPASAGGDPKTPVPPKSRPPGLSPPVRCRASRRGCEMESPRSSRSAGVHGDCGVCRRLERASRGVVGAEAVPRRVNWGRLAVGEFAKMDGGGIWGIELPGCGARVEQIRARHTRRQADRRSAGGLVVDCASRGQQRLRSRAQEQRWRLVSRSRRWRYARWQRRANWLRRRRSRQASSSAARQRWACMGKTDWHILRDD